MKFEELMSGLAGELGIRDDFRPDEDGTVTLEADGVVLSFLEQADYPVPGHTALLMWGRFDGPADEAVEALDAEMLRANDRPDGPTLALFDEKVCLQQALPLDRLDVRTLALKSNDFLGELLGWRERVRGENAADAAEDAAFDGSAAAAAEEPEVRRIDVDGTEVTVVEDAERGFVAYRCVAGRLPASGTARFRRAMLHANFMGRNTAGARLAVSEGDEIVLSQTLPSAFADDELAGGLVRSLAAVARQWRQFAETYAPVAARQEADQEDERKLARRMVASTFLRV